MKSTVIKAFQRTHRPIDAIRRLGLLTAPSPGILHDGIESEYDKSPMFRDKSHALR
jgi:hypothetical protein